MTDVPVTTLVWVRHGEADSNRDGRFGGHSPAALTPKGVRQAQATARALTRLQPAAIIASDLMRARQTAEPIADACKLPLVLEPGLRERSLGVLDGLSFQEAEQLYPELWKRMRDPDMVPERGETHDAVFARVAAVIDRAVMQFAGQTVVLVSHGLALYHAFCHVCGLGSPRAGHQVFVLVDNCSVSRLEHRVDKWRIMTLNDVSHLEAVTDDVDP